jgi:hypothetical protein
MLDDFADKGAVIEPMNLFELVSRFGVFEHVGTNSQHS